MSFGPPIGLATNGTFSGNLQSNSSSVDVYTMYVVQPGPPNLTFRRVTQTDLGTAFSISGTITYISS